MPDYLRPPSVPKKITPEFRYALWLQSELYRLMNQGGILRKDLVELSGKGESYWKTILLKLREGMPRQPRRLDPELYHLLKDMDWGLPPSNLLREVNHVYLLTGKATTDLEDFQRRGLDRFIELIEKANLSGKIKEEAEQLCKTYASKGLDYDYPEY